MQGQVETGAPSPIDSTQSPAFARVSLRPVCIRYGGHDYVASPEMAGIFLRHAQQLIDDGDAQLVPLLHAGGIDLLLVAAEIPLSVHEAPDE